MLLLLMFIIKEYKSTDDNIIHFKIFQKMLQSAKYFLFVFFFGGGGGITGMTLRTLAQNDGYCST